MPSSKVILSCRNIQILDFMPGKGQLISKCLYGVFTFFQKTNKNKSTSSKVEFVCSFFGRIVGLKKSRQGNENI